ncbi:hypothetical protein IMG5_119530, partial [Ichthyophthirius multifiliis]
MKIEENIDKEELEDFRNYPDYMVIENKEEIEKTEKELQSELQNSQKKQYEEEKQKSENSSQTDSEEDEYLEIKLESTEENPQILQAPKHLYDCLLGLRSENRKRFELSIKHLNYLIRKSVDDLFVMWEELTNQLLRIHEIDNWIPNFDFYRKRALISLCIFKPEYVSKIIIDRFFSDECYIGDKHFTIQILMETTDELANNPNKYMTEKFNEFTQNEDSNFYFEKISTTY